MSMFLGVLTKGNNSFTHNDHVTISHHITEAQVLLVRKVLEGMVGQRWVCLGDTLGEQLVSLLVLPRQVEAEGDKHEDQEGVTSKMRRERNAS